MSLKPPTLSSEALSVIITDRCVDMYNIMCVRDNVVVAYVYINCVLTLAMHIVFEPEREV